MRDWIRFASCLLVALAFLAAIFFGGASSAAAATWDRSPNTIIIQFNESGGLAAPQATQLPQWTLYGDGYLVWTTSGPATPGFSRRVWTGTLSDAQINELVALADQLGFWSLRGSSGTGAATTTSSGAQMIQVTPPDQRSGTLTFNLSDRRHSVQIYPAGSASAPQAYRTLRDRLLATQPANAAAFAPTSFRLQARSLGAATGNRAQLAEWPFAEVSLANVASRGATLNGTRGNEIGTFLIAQNYNARQGGIAYNVKLFGQPPRPTTLR